MSGTPFTVFDSTDVSDQGGAPEISGFSANRPNVVAGSIRTLDQEPQPLGLILRRSRRSFLIRILQSSNSATPDATSVSGRATADWDFSIFKNFRVTESRGIQFRAEFFNLLNHPNFRLPDSDVSSPTFNQIQAALPPRVVQLALKFLF